MDAFALDHQQHDRIHKHAKDQQNNQGQDHENQQQETTFTQTNLVSDGFVTAPTIDPNLINPWGVSFSSTSPFWVSDNGAGVATIYNGDGTPAAPAGHHVVTIATVPGATEPAAPTGQVFNSSGSGFDISSGGTTAPSVFIFATEDGTISGWNPAVNGGNSSVLAVDNSQEGLGAVYKGLALGQTSDGPRLFAADFRNAKVDIFDQNFQQIGSFTDHKLPDGFAPFNVQVLDDKLFVTFALQDADKHDDVAGRGNGFVDEFSLNGKFLDRVASGGPLDSPWGLAIAPSGFGDVANDLLVGNFGDGTINVFDPKSDHFLGKLLGADGNPIVIGDLWALVPGNNSPTADPNAIYFTAGVQQEAHGLFGTLTAVQEDTQNQQSQVSMSVSHS
jgi:uncharacterized protein (TIGR03118 family)